MCELTMFCVEILDVERSSLFGTIPTEISQLSNLSEPKKRTGRSVSGECLS